MGRLNSGVDKHWFIGRFERRCEFPNCDLPIDNSIHITDSGLLRYHSEMIKRPESRLHSGLNVAVVETRRLPTVAEVHILLPEGYNGVILSAKEAAQLRDWLIVHITSVTEERVI
jgi:hypothetical protein